MSAFDENYSMMSREQQRQMQRGLSHDLGYPSDRDMMNSARGPRSQSNYFAPVEEKKEISLDTLLLLEEL